jgi:hypothetical protein
MDTQPVRLNFIDTQQTSDRYSKVDEMASSDARAILTKYHRISMEEIFAQTFALCTTYMWYSMCIDMWIDTELV